MLRDIKTQKQWEEGVLDGNWAFVEFYASWCPHCKKMEPIVEELGNIAETDECKVFRIDIDELPQISRLFATTVPTFVMFHKGIPKKFTEGERSLEELETAMSVTKKSAA